MERNTYDLQTRFDSRRSFYGKAKVEVEGDTKRLYSYDTHVSTIENGLFSLNFDVREELLFSHTTLRHIKEFMQQNGLSLMNKKELENLR